MDAVTLNTNRPALTANRNSDETRSTLANIRERLSTGLRINSAKDDAAGLALSSRLEMSIVTLQQGLINTMDGISMSQIATGALNEYLGVLQRLRVLSARASSETLTDLARRNLQDEVDQLVDQLRKLAHETKFDGVSLLDRGKVSQGAPKVKSLSPITQVTSGGADTLPDLSPDGTKLVFSRGPSGSENIFIKDLGSGTETQLTPGGTGRNRYAAFSPDGAKVVFSSDRVTGTNPTGDREIFSMNVDGSGVTQLTTNVEDDSHPRYSPNGTRVAYATGVFTAGANQDIATIDSTLGDGGGVTQVTTSSNFNYHPAYSPDGSQIAYVTDLPPPSTSLHINTTSSTPPGAPTTVSHNFLQMEGPVYSADGSFIFFRAAQTGAPPFNYGLFVTNANGTSVSDFTLLFDFASPADEGRPAISMTTGMIAFSSDTAGSNNIYSTIPNIQKSFIINGDQAEIQVGDDTGQIKTITLTNVDPGKLGLTSLDITTFDGAQNAMKDIDSAMGAILGEQAKMGAQENTLQQTTRANSQYLIDLKASEGRIVDTNIAQESTNLAKELIKQNMQTAIRSQANMLSVSLLRIIASAAGRNN